MLGNLIKSETSEAFFPGLGDIAGRPKYEFTVEQAHSDPGMGHPKITQFDPAKDSTVLPNTNIILTFDQNVIRAASVDPNCPTNPCYTGYFVLMTQYPASTIKIPASDAAQVTFKDNVVTINPANYLGNAM